MDSKGARLKQLRLRHGLTQEEVGKRIHVTKQTLYKYENDIVTNIPSDKVEMLAEIYHTTPAYILGWNEPTPARHYTTLPVVGDIAAGPEIFSEIPQSWDETVDVPPDVIGDHDASDFFVLNVKGRSMLPHFEEGDKLVFLRTPDVSNGKVHAVRFNDGYTVKTVHTDGNGGVMLTAYNPEEFSPRHYGAQEAAEAGLTVEGILVWMCRRIAF